MLKKDILKILILKKIRVIFGRREITPEEEAKYAKINKIDGINQLYEEYNITKEDIEKAKEELESNILAKEQNINIEKDKDIKEEFEI